MDVRWPWAAWPAGLLLIGLEAPYLYRVWTVICPAGARPGRSTSAMKLSRVDFTLFGARAAGPRYMPEPIDKAGSMGVSLDKPSSRPHIALPTKSRH